MSEMRKRASSNRTKTAGNGRVASAVRFTYASRGLMIDYLTSKSKANYTHFLRKVGVPLEKLDEADDPDRGDGKLGHLQRLFDRMSDSDLARIAEAILSELRTLGNEARYDALVDKLLSDGYTVADSRLAPAPVDPTTELDAVQVLVARVPCLSHDTLTHHLEQAAGLWVANKPGPAISEARNFVEQLLVDVARALAESRSESPNLTRPVLVRDYLQQAQFFDTSERKKLVDGVYGFFSEKGPHPGIPDQSVGRLARIVFLAVVQYLLEKADREFA